MADSSFDIVSKVDRQEVDNALNQAAKEVSQRYDFRNVGASIAWSGETIVMVANSAERVLAILDVFETKLIKRGISLKSSTRATRSPRRRARSTASSRPSRRACRARTRRRSPRSSATRAPRP